MGVRLCLKWHPCIGIHVSALLLTRALCRRGVIWDLSFCLLSASDAPIILLHPSGFCPQLTSNMIISRYKTLHMWLGGQQKKDRGGFLGNRKNIIINTHRRPCDATPPPFFGAFQQRMQRQSSSKGQSSEVRQRRSFQLVQPGVRLIHHDVNIHKKNAQSFVILCFLALCQSFFFIFFKVFFLMFFMFCQQGASLHVVSAQQSTIVTGERNFVSMVLLLPASIL